MADHHSTGTGPLRINPTPAWPWVHIRWVIIALVVLAIAGCDQKPAVTPANLTSTYDITGELLAMRQNANALGNASARFLAGPDQASRESLQKAWVAAHIAYLKLSTGNAVPPPLAASIDPWPIEPGFIDTLPDYPDSGIVSDTTLSITSATLREQHQFSDEVEVSLGFHVIEYFAFSRQVEDFLPGVEPNDRRRLMLAAVVAALIQDLGDALGILEVAGSGPAPQAMLETLQANIALMARETQMQPGHGQASGTVNDGLLVRAQTTQSLLFEFSNIDRTLEATSPRLASDMRHNLQEITGLLLQDITRETEGLRVLVTGLDFQLREAATVLGGGQSTPGPDPWQP